MLGFRIKETWELWEAFSTDSRRFSEWLGAMELDVGDAEADMPTSVNKDEIRKYEVSVLVVFYSPPPPSPPFPLTVIVELSTVSVLSDCCMQMILCSALLVSLCLSICLFLSPPPSIPLSLFSPLFFV